MLKRDLISALMEHGIDSLYGKTLSGLKKKELEEAHRLLVELEAPDHMSFTKVNLYQRCGMQYYWRYVRGLKLPPAAAMTMGSAYDGTASYAYQQMIDQKNAPPVSVLKDVFREDFRSREEGTDWRNEKPNEYRQMGIELVESFTESFLPETIPTAVQKKHVIKFQNRPYTFVAIPDFEAVSTNDKIALMENKVSKRKYADTVVDIHPQLTAYAATVVSDEPVEIPAVGIDLGVYGKGAASHRYLGIRTGDDIRRWWTIVDRVFNAVANKVFLPAPVLDGSRPSWVCTPEWCGYWHVCHEEV